MIKNKAFPVACMVIAVILFGYGAGVWYYKGHLFRNTRVNNYALSNLTVSEAEDTFVRDLKAHEITVVEKERSETIHASDVGVSIDVGSQIEDLKSSQNPWSWPLHFFGTDQGSIHLDVSFDEAKVSGTVDNMECFREKNVTPPADAHIEAGAEQFSIIPEVPGNKVKKEMLKKQVKNALTNCVNTIELEKEGLYYLPVYYAKDKLVTDALKKANTYAHTSITYDYIYTKQTLDYNTLKDWIDISSDFKVTINSSKAGDYVADMQKEYNTMGTARKFITADNEEITIVEGDYGWKVDFRKEKARLLKDVKAGKSVSREPEWEYRGVVRKGKRDDIGGTYVEVSIKKQTVWMFVDGECIASDSCCTGNPSQKASTKEGIYSITFKKSPATLTGPDAEKGSYSSDVTYWMPFNGNQGLHDATWRKAFGGNIYKTNGSHGCVNLPFDMAETIWNHVEKGYPVIIY